MKYLTRTKETAQRWFISGLKGENTDNVFYTGSEGEPWSPRLHPIFFSLPDAEKEEAVRRQTCCVAVALGAFRFTNTSCLIFNHSFIEIIPLSFAVALTTYRAPNYRMWNYWCMQPPTHPPPKTPSSSSSSTGKLAFLASWENHGNDAEWKCSPSSVIELDFTRWIARTGVYPNYIAERFQSRRSHCGQQQLGSTLSY